METQIPRGVSALFWSSPRKVPDLQKDASEIVHKVLALGTLEDIRWLKKAYSPDSLQKVFQEKPLQIYSPSAFHFATTIVLRIDQKNLDKNQYVKAVY